MYDSFLESVAQKFGYSEELLDALKRVVPVMLDGKDEETSKLLLDTIERVEIVVFDEEPTQEEVDGILSQKVAGRNNHVKFKYEDRGEYGKKVSVGAYCNEPIFDDEMNIIDRAGALYITKLYKNSETAKYYGTRIDLSHLIHELGHAWAAQKDEYVQDENGDYIESIGMLKGMYTIDKKTHEVTQVSEKGLYNEEAINSIEEEKALCKLFGIESLEEIPDYIHSFYMGIMTIVMKEYMEKLGSATFEKYRIAKQRDTIDYLDGLKNFKFMEQMDDAYYKEKEDKIKTYRQTVMSEEAKKRVDDFFDEYKTLYFTKNKPNNLLDNLDNCLKQLYNFQRTKYPFDIMDPTTNESGLTIFDAYKIVNRTIRREAEEPLAEIEIDKEGQKDGSKISLSAIRDLIERKKDINEPN